MSDLPQAARAPAQPLGLRLAWVVLAAAVLALPLLANEYIQYILNSILVYVVVAVGFNVVLGYLGQLAFANAAFFGVGAYATALLMGRLSVPFPAALLGAAALTSCAGVLVSLPAQRLRAYYLAIVTLATGELLRWMYIHLDWLTNGSTGLPVPTATVAGWALDTERAKYYAFLPLVALVLWATANLLRSRFGRALVALRTNEPAAAAMGVDPARYRVLAFAWSGFVVGIGGAMFAVLLGRISPDSFDLRQLLLQFTIVMIGGIGSLLGSVAGAVLLTAAPELLRNFPGIDEIAFSLMLIVVLLFLPMGLAGLLVRLAPWLRERFVLE